MMFCWRNHRENPEQMRVADQKAFTLIELLAVIIIAGFMASLLVSQMGPSLENTKQVETVREMERIANAVTGNPSVLNNGVRSDFGYVGDVGAFPPNLTALTVNPGGWPTWDGPYLDLDLSEDSLSFIYDGWNVPYQYNVGVELVSTGSGSSIRKKLADRTSDILMNGFNGLIRDAVNNMPGPVYDDSILIEITIPSDSGRTILKSYHPDSTGKFFIDTLPIGTHPLNIISLPTSDTLHRYLTIFPRHMSPGQYRFGSVLFSEEDSTETPVSNSAVIFSTSENAVIASLNLDDDDLVEYIPADRNGSVYLDGGTIFHHDEDINGFDLLDNGNILLTTADNARIGSLNFGDDDIVEYDPATGIAMLYFNGSVFSTGSETIDAVAVLPNGNIVLSTQGHARIGALSFEEGDLVEYDLSGGNASLYFDHNTFHHNENIDAVDILDNGTILLSTASDASIHGLHFTDADVIAYDPDGDSAWIFFRGYAEFESSHEDIDAFSSDENAPRKYESLIVVRSSINPGGCDQLNFTLENFTGDDIAFTGITLTYGSPTAYFGKIDWDGSEIFDASGTRPGSGDAVVFGSPQVIANNSSVEVEIKEFRDSPSGGGDVDMDNTAFLLELSDGSSLELITGDCQ